MKNADRIRRKQRNKIKLMITEHNAEPHVSAAAVRPDSDPSIENQNGRTSLVGSTDPVSSASPRGEGTGERDRASRQPELHHTTKPGANGPSLIQNPKSKIQNVNGQILLNDLESLLQKYVVLPTFAPETLALWVLHTYAFELRDVSTYLGVESPEKRCGKTTLLSVLNRLANRPVAAANISPSAFFRVIEDMRPTLLIDEADTFLRGNDEIRGILNAGYTRDTAYVLRVQAHERGVPITEQTTQLQSAPPPSSFNSFNAFNPFNSASPCNSSNSCNPINSFSCWCPKVMAAIGRLPDTLADRCIVIRMQRKTINEECARLRNLDATGLRERCLQFVQENHNTIASAQPAVPETLNDRAADIWEPLLVLADIAGGEWPTKARRAAEGLTANSHGRSPIGSLLFDILFVLCGCGYEPRRLFSRDLVAGLNRIPNRPWADMPGLRSVDSGQRREATELWLARQLRPYGVRPRVLRIGEQIGKGYDEEDLLEVFQRYIPRSEVDDFKQEHARRQAEAAQLPSNSPNPSAANQ
jgi:hypothetical protein